MSLETAGFIAVWLFVMGYILYRRFWRPSADDRRDYQARVRQLGEANVIATFQRCRSRCLWFGGVPMVVGILTPFLVGYAASGRAVGSHSWSALRRVSVFGVDGIMLVFGGFALFGAGLVFVLLTYRCPVCGESPGDASGLPLNPDVCPACGVRLRPQAAEGARGQAGGTRAAADTRGRPRALTGWLRRVAVSREGDRLVVVKNRLPRVLELGLVAVFFTFWYYTLFSQFAVTGSAFEQIESGLFAVIPVALLGRYVYDLVTTVTLGDVFVFYRTTDRVVRNGRVVCSMQEIAQVGLQRPVTEQGNAVLSLALKDGTRIRVDASAWGDLPAVAEAIAEFVGAEVVTPSRRLFGSSR